MSFPMEIGADGGGRSLPAGSVVPIDEGELMGELTIEEGQPGRRFGPRPEVSCGSGRLAGGVICWPRGLPGDVGSSVGGLLEPIAGWASVFRPCCCPTTSLPVPIR